MRNYFIGTLVLSVAFGLSGCGKTEPTDPDQPKAEDIKDLDVNIDMGNLGTPGEGFTPAPGTNVTSDGPPPAFDPSPGPGADPVGPPPAFNTTPDPFKDIQNPAPAVTLPTNVGELMQSIEDPAASEAALAALRQQGDAAITQLLDQLNKDEATVRSQAAFALGQIGNKSEQVIDALKKIAESDPDQSVQTRARFALDSLQDQ